VALFGSIAITYVYFVTAFVLALAGAHGVARWKAVVAGIVGVVVAGFLAGAVPKIPTVSKLEHKLGPHLALEAPRSEHYKPRIKFDF
jgi:hypothetical protein